jgi:hypothetical protein
MAFSSYLAASAVTVACFVSKFTWTCLTHGKDVSALRTPAGQPTGQVIPVTAIVTCFVLSALPAEVRSVVAWGRSSAVLVGVFCKVLDGQDEQPLARPMVPTTPISKIRWNTRVLLLF